MTVYKRPPITEALIELRFAEPVSTKLVSRAAKALQPKYGFRDPERGQQFKIDIATAKAEATTTWTCERLSSFDRADTTIFRETTFICSRLAPYLGWDQFRDRANEAWEAWRKIVGSIELSRIGVRYINRIDIPVQPNEKIELQDYLHLYPHAPDGQAPITGFAMQVTRPVGADDCNVAINSASVVAPLIGFYSFLLDFDLFREINLPRRDDQLWQLLDRIRIHKNNLFESCITERARQIFNQ